MHCLTSRNSGHPVSRYGAGCGTHGYPLVHAGPYKSQGKLKIKIKRLFRTVKRGTPSYGICHMILWEISHTIDPGNLFFIILNLPGLVIGCYVSTIKRVRLTVTLALYLLIGCQPET